MTPTARRRALGRCAAARLAWLFLILFSLPAVRAWAADTDPLLLQAPDAAWLRDPGGRMTVEQAAARAASFQPLQRGLSAGFTRDAYWFRVVLPAAAQGGERWLEVPPGVLDDVRLYEPRADGGWSERRSGNAVPFDLREAPYRAASFRLAQARQGEVLYLRVQSARTMAVMLYLWHGPALQAANERENVGYGLYLGFMLTVVLFNLAGWLATRRSLYGLFALFVLAATTRWFAADGLAGQFLFPHDTATTLLFTNVLLGVHFFCVSLFQSRLLQFREYFPFLYRYAQFIMLMGVLVVVASFTGHFGAFATVLYAAGLLGHALSIPAYLRQWRSGSFSGRLTAAAFIVSGRLTAAGFILYCLSILPSILGTLGLIRLDPAALQAAHLVDLPLVLILHLSIVLQVRDAERTSGEAQRQASDALASSLRERAAREEQSRLLAMMTHEVRTPVAVIDAANYSLRLLDESGADRGQRGSRYESIQLAVRRLKSLMELAEARERLMPDGHRIEAAPLDLADLSREVLATVEPQVAERVVLEVDAPLPRHEGEARLLYFVLLNLLDNAVKYAKPATPIRIGIAPGPNEGRRGVVWRISDSGPGVPEGKEEAIFERFLRLDGAADQPGLGLGLPLARKIVEQHAGRLWCDTRRRDGASFVVWLPEAS
ncbi:sensor histidine kinase [Cupriavidus basilensis]|uniref:histidine kinase n=1 Tax=Cupriavidus basilensis TaxID=68895 RepID=A0ABT6B2X9_9BURK|nr:sensor histidine kinase [Cupriavidus basilensis]MDF3839230.1 sensor histidine kinase [Cupriavidus basilensis]